MKTFFSAIVLLLSASHLMAQGTAIPSNIRAINTLEDLTQLTPNEVLYGIPLPPKKLVGDSYLVAHWRKTNILLYTKETLLEGYPVRYDLLRDELEVNSKSGIKVLEAKRVKSFVWLDSITMQPEYFINAGEYKNTDKGKLLGFFLIMVDGKLPLFKKTVATIKEADYNVQFSVGSRDDKIIKKDLLFYARDGVVCQLPKSRKKVFSVFGDKAKAMEEFVKTNSLDATDTGDLKKMFIHFNSLM
jgi:hypothetical protein